MVASVKVNYLSSDGDDISLSNSMYTSESAYNSDSSLETCSIEIKSERSEETPCGTPRGSPSVISSGPNLSRNMNDAISESQSQTSTEKHPIVTPTAVETTPTEMPSLNEKAVFDDKSHQSSGQGNLLSDSDPAECSAKTQTLPMDDVTKVTSPDKSSLCVATDDQELKTHGCIFEISGNECSSEESVDASSNLSSMSEADLEVAGYSNWLTNSTDEDEEETVQWCNEVLIHHDSVLLESGSSEGLTINDVLERLGCELHETELWALCRECVLALHRHKNQLPAYISLTTVKLEVSGRVSFCSVPDDHVIEGVYLAPELQQQGVVTEKTCLFGIAAMLWNAADYKLPTNQEPNLTTELENMLISMTNEDTDIRPSASDVLQTCNDYHRRQETNSTQVCKSITRDANSANDYGKNNAFVKKDLDQLQVVQHKDLLSSIQNAKSVDLKPVSERTLPNEKPIVKTDWDRFLEEIHGGRKLRKTSRPKTLPVKDWFNASDELMKHLIYVTKAGRECFMNQNAPEQPVLPAAPQQRLLPGAQGQPPFQPREDIYGKLGPLNNNNIGIYPNIQGQAFPQQPEQPMFYQQHPQPQMQPANAYNGIIPQPQYNQQHNLSGQQGFYNTPQNISLPQQQPHLFQQQSMVLGHQQLPEPMPNLRQTQYGASTAGSAFQAISPNGQLVKPNVFSPIVVNDGKTAAGVTQLKNQLDVDGQTEDERRKAKKLRDLKLQLRRNRPPVDLANDLEIDAGRDSTTKSVLSRLSDDGRASSALSAYQNYSSHNGGERVISPSGRRSNSPHSNVLRSTFSSPHINSPHSVIDHANQNPSVTPVLPLGGASSYKLIPDVQTGNFHLIPVGSASITPVQEGFQSMTLNPSGTISPSSSHSQQNRSDLSDKHERRTPRYIKKQANRRSRSRSDVSEKVGKIHEAQALHGQFHPGQSHPGQSHPGQTHPGESYYGQQLDDPLSAHMYRTTSRDNLHTPNSLHNMDTTWETSTNGNLSRVLSSDYIHELSVSKSLDMYSSREHIPTAAHHKNSHTKLKRAKSGSSLDYRQGGLGVRAKEIALEGYHHKNYHRMMHDVKPAIVPSRLLSKSQPNLAQELLDYDRSQRGAALCASPSQPLSLANNSSASSPSLDSGVSGVHVRLANSHALNSGVPVLPTIDNSLPPSTEAPSLMERFITSHAKHSVEDKMHNIIQLIRNEFAYDGYMENGVEDTLLAEYILQLANLKWETFTNAIKEKYCDLFFMEDLLVKLYHCVNGKDPVIGEPKVPPRRKHGATSVTGTRRTVREVKDTRRHGQVSMDISNITPLDMYSSAADQRKSSATLPQTASLKDSNVSTSDSEPEPERPRRYRKRQPLDKTRSSSMHNLAPTNGSHDIDSIAAYVPSQILVTRKTSQGGKMIGNNPMSRHSIAVVDAYNPQASEHDPYSQVNQTRVQHSAPHSGNSIPNLSAANGAGHIPVPRQFSDDVTATRNGFHPPPQQHQRHHQHQQQQHHNHHRTVTADAANSRTKQLPLGASRLPTRNLTRQESQSSSHSGNSYSHRLLALSKSEGSLNMRLSTSGSDSSSLKDKQFNSRYQSSSIVYYSAEIHRYMTPEVQEFAKQMHAEPRDRIENKLSEMEQEMTMEHRMKKKTFNYYQKLLEAKSTKGSSDHKPLLAKMSKQLQEMNERLLFLDAAKKHLEMLYSEQWGLDQSLLFTLESCRGDMPLQLVARENPNLVYQVPKLNEKRTNHVQLLQAGTPNALLTYLFANHALSQGFIHEFFYTFRYFLSANDLFLFLCNKFSSSILSDRVAPSPAAVCVKRRCLDLIQTWISGYFTVDFVANAELAASMYSFIQEHIIPVDNQADFLLELFEDCQHGRHNDLEYPQFKLYDSIEEEQMQAENYPKKWESFKAALHLSAKPITIKNGARSRSSVASLDPHQKASNKRMSLYIEDEAAYFAQTGPKRGDSFTLADYTSYMLAEQLTLIQQDLFRKSHPVNYLNSKAHGIGVQMANRSHSMQKLHAWGEVHEQSLFESNHESIAVIKKLLDHAQAVTSWVIAEIVSCTTTKKQVAVVSKFIYAAKICQDARDFATCISIVDALENLIIRQLPVWKNLPSKCIAMVGELSAVKVFLKKDALSLINPTPTSSAPGTAAKGACLSRPTIPCVLLLLLHIQQMELGTFRMANGMVKWQKMKSICQVIDQIRLFQQNRYDFEIDVELQSALTQRMREFALQDLAELASLHDTNYHKMASSGKLKKMFAKFGGKNEK